MLERSNLLFVDRCLVPSSRSSKITILLVSLKHRRIMYTIGIATSFEPRCLYRLQKVVTLLRSNNVTIALLLPRAIIIQCLYRGIIKSGIGE